MKIVKGKVKSGLYNNASEVIREAIRQLDAYEHMIYESKLTKLREALAPGIKQAEAGKFAEYSLKGLLSELDNDPSA